MPESYRSRSPLTQVEPQALVIYCSAARYQQHFAEFLVDGLNLEDYSLIAIPGGVQVLTLLDYLPKFSWAGWRWAKFLVDADEPARAILIGHEDCRWYKYLFAPKSSKERITSDLRRAAEELHERFPRLRVELYFARTDAHGHIVFDPA